MPYGNGGSYGHGILSRYPINNVRFGRLPSWRRQEPRGALHVEVEVAGRAVHVFGIHLGLWPHERSAQAQDLLSERWIGSLADDDPIVLLGDFNTSPGSRAYRRISHRLADVQASLRGHTACRTFPSIWPARCLDHIFVSSHFTPNRIAVPDDEFVRRTSDHLPLVVDLNWCLQEPDLAATDTQREAAVGTGV